MFGFGKRQKQEKKRAEFEAEFAPHVGDIYRIALFLSKNHAEAQDLAQDTIVEALKAFHNYGKGTNIKAWMMTIMYRQYAEMQVKNRKSPAETEKSLAKSRTLTF